MLSWQYFKTIRKIRVEEWVRNRRINSYEKFVSVLRALGVSAPPREEVAFLFPEKKPAKPKPAAKVSKPKPVVLEASAPEEEKVVSEEPKPTLKRRSRKAKIEKEEVVEHDTGEA
ncbi:MAG: hypothetical protein ACW96N_00095 [Candidatus Thorarchaeota archaeon]|jgi:hypothetical protein